MDLQTSFVCAGIVAVSASVVYLTSVLGIKEKTYEEAIEEQRKRNHLDEIVKPNKSEKPKKDKKDKIKKSKDNKKPKEKVTDGESHSVVDKNESQSQQLNQQQNNANVNVNVNVNASSKKVEHVEFKPQPEVVILRDEELSESERQRKLSSASDKSPSKPILVKKNETKHGANDLLAENRTQQKNSFDKLIPKDELELSKIKELKKNNEGNKGESKEKVKTEPKEKNVKSENAKNETKQNLGSNSKDNKKKSDELNSKPNSNEKVESQTDSFSQTKKIKKQKQVQLIQGKLFNIFYLKIIIFSCS